MLIGLSNTLRTSKSGIPFSDIIHRKTPDSYSSFLVSRDFDHQKPKPDDLHFLQTTANMQREEACVQRDKNMITCKVSKMT